MKEAECVDCRCPLRVDMCMWMFSRGGSSRGSVRGAVDQVRVANIDRFFPWGETDSIRSAESIRHNANVARARIEAVYMLGQLRFRSKASFVAVDWICEPNCSVRVDDDVTGRIKGARVKIV